MLRRMTLYLLCLTTLSAGPASRPATEPATQPADKKGALFADHGGARSVVFVCDATGTMISKMATLKAALIKTVGELKPEQSFNIVFYFDGPKFTSLAPGLVPANAKNKKRVTDWLDDIVSERSPSRSEVWSIFAICQAYIDEAPM